MISTKTPKSRAELGRGIELGWQTGAQLYASVDGKVIADFGLGEARPGASMNAGTIVEWGSATKPVTCCAAALLWQQGLFDLDDPVCRYLPTFAAQGKEAVTIRHLLTHTGGLTNPMTKIAPIEEVAEAISEAPMIEGWVPGTRCGYNSDAMWIVARLVAQLSGRQFAEFVRAEIFEPLGLFDSWIAMPIEQFRTYGERIAIMPGFAQSGTERWVTWGRPTGGGHGPIGELAGFYQALLQHQLLAPPVLEAMTARQLCGVFDETLQATVDWGLGFSLSSSYPGHGYGPYASRRAFGHGGRNWCVAFADPYHGLAAAVYWNGRVDAATHAERQPRLLGALYEDLGLSNL